MASAHSRQGPDSSQNHLNVSSLDELHKQSHPITLEDSLWAGIFSSQHDQVVSRLGKNFELFILKQ